MRGMPCSAMRPHVLGLGANGQNTAGDARVNGLDAAVEHLGELGDFGDFAQGGDAAFL